MILLGISFLVFYTLGMAYRRQPVLVIKCNETRPASNVYYHTIVQRGTYVPFSLYADYLANMATQYPLLNFHVLFLVDDSLQNALRGPRHVRFLNKMIPYGNANAYPLIEEENNYRELIEFEARYQNVNVTIMFLSKFMATTPLKYKWRTIPLSYITFYARVFSVWQNGGVGMDLNTFNNNYNNHKCVDRRISAIMKQHNDGIKVEEYTNALNAQIVREEENDLLNMFCGLIYQIMNETRSMLSKSFPIPQITTEKSLSLYELLIGSERTERDASTQASDQNNKTEPIVYVEFLNSTNDTDLKKNEYQTLSDSDPHLGKFEVTINDAFRATEMNNSSRFDATNKTEVLNKSEIQTEITNKSEAPQVVLYYDVTLFSDNIAPPFILPEQFMRTDFRQNGKRSEIGKAGKNGNNGAYLLSLDSEGMFVAAASRLHPFLGHLISTGCQRIHHNHRIAIHETLLSQCSGIFKDIYCNNIYLLYL